jgi:hypothetical protein
MSLSPRLNQVLKAALKKSLGDLEAAIDDDLKPQSALLSRLESAGDDDCHPGEVKHLERDRGPGRERSAR